MVYGGIVWHRVNLLLLKNPSLTVAEGAKIVRDIKEAIGALEC